MYRFRLSGTDDDGLPDYDARRAEAEKVYESFLRGLDLSDAGDLLLFFGRDFFHDGPINGISVLDDGRSVDITITGWTEGDDTIPPGIDFRLRFEEVAWLGLETDPYYRNRFEFLYSEIDGLTDRIAEAVAAHGGVFHSLAIETGTGWIQLVFRTVAAIPQDSVVWARAMRSPNTQLNMWGLDEST